MRLFFNFLLAGTLLCNSSFSPTFPSRSCGFLENYLPKSDKRYRSFEFALQLLNERHAQVIVETGTARYGKDNFIGDGGSTYIFGEWASKNKAIFYSVDLNLEALRRAQKDLDPSLIPYVHLIHSDSVAFLSQFDAPIDFLYLDSYDFDLRNPRPSQEHHLNEIVAAYPKLTPSSVVMIDDCDLPHGGKGKLVIDYLLKRGWNIALEGYQVILTRDEKSPHNKREDKNIKFRKKT